MHTEEDRWREWFAALPQERASEGMNGRILRAAVLAGKRRRRRTRLRAAVLVTAATGAVGIGLWQGLKYWDVSFGVFRNDLFPAWDFPAWEIGSLQLPVAVGGVLLSLLLLQLLIDRTIGRKMKERKV